MRYKPKSIPALHIALGGLPAKMRVSRRTQTSECLQRPYDLRPSEDTAEEQD
jgi:hypothetical protein